MFASLFGYLFWLGFYFFLIMAGMSGSEEFRFWYHAMPAGMGASCLLSVGTASIARTHWVGRVVALLFATPLLFGTLYVSRIYFV